MPLLIESPFALEAARQTFVSLLNLTAPVATPSQVLNDREQDRATSAALLTRVMGNKGDSGDSGDAIPVQCVR
ncbi:hypothetical protein [Ramlibacter sp.]|uniref:hypothetical protein n=1 Tax=Ramlibacter sp. TaxID=1917967 RepID=UPI003D0F142F